MIDLYYWTTPNGHKITLFLEETGLPYKIHPVNISRGDQFKPEFLAIAPNNRIPAIVDQAPAGGGAPISLFESGAILVYLAEKTGSPLLPADPAARYETLQWLMFQMGGVGPMFGQVGFFHKFAGKDFEDKRPRDRYVNEAVRLLGVLERRLAGRAWVMGEQYTIADIALWPWVRNMVVEQGYNAATLLGWERFPELQRVLAAFVERPAVQKGLVTPPRN
jgi:GST-like protein